MYFMMKHLPVAGLSHFLLKSSWMEIQDDTLRYADSEKWNQQFQDNKRLIIRFMVGLTYLFQIINHFFSIFPLINGSTCRKWMTATVIPCSDCIDNRPFRS